MLEQQQGKHYQIKKKKSQILPNEPKQHFPFISTWPDTPAWVHNVPTGKTIPKPQIFMIKVAYAIFGIS